MGANRDEINRYKWRFSNRTQSNVKPDENDEDTTDDEDIYFSRCQIADTANLKRYTPSLRRSDLRKMTAHEIEQRAKDLEAEADIYDESDRF